MLVNRTVLTEKDAEFINSMLRRQPLIIIVRIIGTLLALFWLFCAGLLIYAQIRLHRFSGAETVEAVFFLVLGLFVGYRTVFLRRSSLRRTMKSKSLFAPRTYTFEEDGVRAVHSFEGTEISRKLAYANLEKAFETEGAIMLRFCGEEKKQKVYMCMHDDGWLEGSRGELIKLLREKCGVQIAQK